MIDLHCPIVYALKKSARDFKVQILTAHFDKNPKIYALVYNVHGWRQDLSDWDGGKRR